MRFGFLLAVILFAGCATHSAIVKTHSYENVLKPAWLPDSLIKLGLSQRSDLTDDLLILKAVVKGQYEILGSGSLHFIVDGNIYRFAPMGKSTLLEKAIEPKSSGSAGLIDVYYSSRQYIISVLFLEKILTAQHVVVRVDLEGAQVEGVFSEDGAFLARPAFRTLFEQKLK